jgi:hypothetical protein
MNMSEIIQLKFPDVDFFNQVQLQDDGQGPYIKKWDESLGPIPDQAMLDAWEIEVVPLKEAALVIENRIKEYASIEDQLDMMYKDKINNTNTWEAHITGVKTKYPKKV